MPKWYHKRLTLSEPVKSFDQLHLIDYQHSLSFSRRHENDQLKAQFSTIFVASRKWCFMVLNIPKSVQLDITILISNSKIANFHNDKTCKYYTLIHLTGLYSVVYDLDMPKWHLKMKQSQISGRNLRPHIYNNLTFNYFLLTINIL